MEHYRAPEGRPPKPGVIQLTMPTVPRQEDSAPRESWPCSMVGLDIKMERKCTHDPAVQAEKWRPRSANQEHAIDR